MVIERLTLGKIALGASKGRCQKWAGGLGIAGDSKNCGLQGYPCT